MNKYLIEDISSSEKFLFEGTKKDLLIKIIERYRDDSDVLDSLIASLIDVDICITDISDLECL